MTKLKKYSIFTTNTLNTSFGFDEDNPDCKKLKQMLFNLFLQNKGVYYCDCQAGLGIYSAEMVLNSKNQLFCIIPYEEQPNKWSSDFRERYYSLHEKACDTRFISKRYTETCLEECSNYLADVCDEIFLITSSADGIPPAVKNACNSGKKVTIIDCGEFTFKIAKPLEF